MRKQLQLWIHTAVCAGAILLMGCGSCAMAKEIANRSLSYNAKSEVTVAGIVQGVKQDTGKSLMGTHLLVDTGGSTTDVQIGPQSSLKSSGITFEPGDSVKVTGAITSIHGETFLLARTITRDNQTLVVRNAAGFPVQLAGGKGSRAVANKSKERF